MNNLQLLSQLLCSREGAYRLLGGQDSIFIILNNYRDFLLAVSIFNTIPNEDKSDKDYWTFCIGRTGDSDPELEFNCLKQSLPEDIRTKWERLTEERHQTSNL